MGGCAGLEPRARDAGALGRHVAADGPRRGAGGPTAPRPPGPPPHPRRADPPPPRPATRAPRPADRPYEWGRLALAQLDRQDRDGIWVVNQWRLTAPFAQADPVAVEAQATERLEEFLAARNAGAGAEGPVQGHGD